MNRFLLTSFVAIVLSGVGFSQNYLPKGAPAAGGMKHQVLFYNLNGTQETSYHGTPWVSADGSRIYYSIGQPGEEELWTSTFTTNHSLPPSPIKELRISGTASHSPTLTPDGTRMYFISNRNISSTGSRITTDWRIFVTRLQSDSTWSVPQSIEVEAAAGDKISAPEGYQDCGLFLSRDGKSLYIQSNRPGGFGGFDIWVSTQNEKGNWKTPVNLGKPINSHFDESGGVSLTADNQTLYFGANRKDIRALGNDQWAIFKGQRKSAQDGWNKAVVNQITELFPEEDNSGYGTGWPCISPDGDSMIFSGRGPLLWRGDVTDLFRTKFQGGKWQTPINLGRNINNIMWYRTEDYLPYVAYIDAKTGKPLDFMYDSGLCLALSGSSTGNDYGWGQTLKDDWTQYLDQLFVPNRQLHKLDEVVAQVKKHLNKPDYRFKLAVMVPYPNEKVRDFGDVDNDGISEDFTVPQNRLKANVWYLDNFLSRWSTAQFQNLELVAMYWMSEEVHENAQLVKAVAKEVHQRHLLFEWIPYFFADYSTWRDYGFDCVQYQPNYAWMDRESRGGQPDPNRLLETAHRTRQYGMGYELEIVNRVCKDGLNYRAYLDFGVPEREGYMGDCFTGCYQSVWLLGDMAYASQTSAPFARDGYDSMYQFIKEIYPVCVSFGKKYSYKYSPLSTYADDSLKKLNDYFFLPHADTTAIVVGFEDVDPVITYDLGKQERISKVYSHVIGGGKEGLFFPRSVKVEVSRDGKSWRTAGTTRLHREELGKRIAGDMLVKFQPRTVRYVRVTFERSCPQVWVDEIQVYGAVRSKAQRISNPSH